MGICIIGHFGGKEMFNDGQTVKTIAVFDALSSKGIKPSIVDTYYFHKRNIFRFGCSFIMPPMCSSFMGSASKCYKIHCAKCTKQKTKITLMTVYFLQEVTYELQWRLEQKMHAFTFVDLP